MSFHEYDGWPLEPVSVGEFAPVRKGWVEWANRYTEASTLDDLEYPYVPGCGAYPERMLIEPSGAQNGILNGLAQYERADLTVWYSSKINTNSAIIEELLPTTTIAPCTPMSLYWSDQTAVEGNQKPYIPISGAVFSHTRCKLALVPTAVLTQANCVNATALYSQVLGITFAAETLLAQVPRIKRTWTVSGMTSFKVEQDFVFKSNGGLGWNSCYRPENGAHEYVYDENGVRLRDYATAAFVLA